MTTINDQVEASADDANEITAGSISLLHQHLVLGDAFNTRSGQRFDTLITGLSGVTITDAYLTWRADVTDTGSFVNTMYGDDRVAPEEFTTAEFDISGRAKTAATVAAGSSELGEWTSGEDYTLTVTTIIQELADSYDPSAIVLFSINDSGNGERLGKSFNNDEVLAPKLHITFTSGGQVDISPTTLAYSWTIPTPTFSPQVATFTPTATTLTWTIPSPVIVAGVLIEPDSLTYSWAIPTFTHETSHSPSASTISWTILEPNVLVGVEIVPDALTYSWAIPTFTHETSHIPSAATVTWTIPPPSAVAGVQIITLPITYSWTIPTPTFSPQVVTMLPSASTVTWTINAPTITAGSTVFLDWGEVQRVINVDDYPSNASYYLEVVIQTSSAIVPALAQLWNITDSEAVASSEVTTSSTDPIRIRSSNLTLVGADTYKVQFGGQSGSQITMYGAAIIVETN